MSSLGTHHQRGFTMIELIMVIVILGVIGGMVAVFMKSPIDAYFASARRAALTDVADTAVRRMARDLRKALPNSVRLCPAGINGVMFIPTKTGGRYRTVDAAAGTALNFEAADTSFNMLGNNNDLPANQRIAQDDVIAVYNLGPGIVDAYNQDNTSRVSAAPVDGVETQISIDSKLFPLASGSNRFHVIPGDEQVVSYVCNGANELRRTVSTLVAAKATSCPATGAVLADHVSCTFVYNGSDLQRNALVQISLRFTDSSGESVSLYHEVHVDNTP
jgi:MSHA biogenesis protein MshO